VTELAGYGEHHDAKIRPPTAWPNDDDSRRLSIGRNRAAGGPTCNTGTTGAGNTTSASNPNVSTRATGGAETQAASSRPAGQHARSEA
jgi:hypothetical protein